MLAELQTRALFKVGEPVHWRSTVYKITARYWRRSNDTIVYDLMEVVRPGASARHQRKVRENELARPSPYTLGIDVRM